jgi:hypothetical protein
LSCLLSKFPPGNTCLVCPQQFFAP